MRMRTEQELEDALDEYYQIEGFESYLSDGGCHNFCGDYYESEPCLRSDCDGIQYVCNNCGDNYCVIPTEG